MKAILFVSLAALCVAFIFACSFKAKAEAGPGVPFFGGSSVTIDVDGRKVTPHSDGGEPVDCIKLHFKDGAGNEIGTAEVPAGGSAEAPEGTEDVTWSPCDPKEPKPKGSGSNEAFTAGGDVIVPFRSMPIDMMDGRGRYIDFTVSAKTTAEAEKIAAEFQKNTLARAKPEGVHTYGFVDVKVERDGSLQVALISWGAPKAVSLSCNGEPVTKKRMDAEVFTTSGGWYVVLVQVPSVLVRYAMPYMRPENVISYAISAGEDEISGSVSLVVEP